MLKFKCKIIMFILAMLSLGLFSGFVNLDSDQDGVNLDNSGVDQNDNKVELLVTYQNAEITVEGIYNEEGVLLLPLQKMTSLLGLEFLECGRCGKDEIFSNSIEDPKGHMFVNWYQNVITYSNDPTIILLDANNEKIDGVTYTSAMLYQYLGVAMVIDDQDKTIIINDADNITVGMEDDKMVVDSKAALNRIVYAYDPACSSCEAITALLERIEEEKGTEIVKLDASQEEKKLSIRAYEIQSNVPDELRGIYPILYIGNQYLFYSEITEENINTLLGGNSIEHNFVTGSAISSVSGKDTGQESGKDTGKESGKESGKEFGQVSGNTSELSNISENMEQGDKVLIYFYSTTCASCKSAVELIQMMENKFPDLKLIGYNLYIPDNITLLKAYGKRYDLDKKKIGEIPAVFFSDRAFIGDEEILKELENAIAEYNKDKPTPVIDIKMVIREKNILNGLSVFGAGLLNGVNPCSLSMFLFLLSLVMVDLKKVLKIGISFCVGKFIMFFLLGTLFYRFISTLDIALVDMITQNLLILMIIVFAFLNIYDFVMAKRENYNKMILQLPSWLKGFNQRIMKGSVKYTKSRYVIALMVMIGMLLGFGEFLCTGQIYLASIVILIQGTGREGLAVLYLILYSIAFVLPLFIMTLLVYYGKKVFRFSGGLLEKLPMIKVINSLLFVAYGLYVVFH